MNNQLDVCEEEYSELMEKLVDAKLVLKASLKDNLAWASNQPRLLLSLLEEDDVGNNGKLSQGNDN